MSTIVLAREQARILVDCALSAASHDDVTPVIRAAHIALEGGALRVVSTDRYRVHTTTVIVADAEGDPAAIIPREALEWLRANVSYYGRDAQVAQRVRFDIQPHGESPIGETPGKLSITVSESDASEASSITWTGRHVVGKYPPVLDLIVTARNAEAIANPPLLNLEFVGKVRQLTRRDPAFRVRVKFTASENPNKPGPVYFAVEEGRERTVIAEALTQPHLELS